MSLKIVSDDHLHNSIMSKINYVMGMQRTMIAITETILCHLSRFQLTLQEILRIESASSRTRVVSS
jgi:hypothetical protein